MKFEACCNRFCLLMICNIRDNGGCYCVCKLQDYIHSLESTIEGYTIGCVYIPDEENRKKFISRMKPEKYEEYINFREKKAPILLQEAKQCLNNYIIE